MDRHFLIVFQLFLSISTVFGSPLVMAVKGRNFQTLYPTVHGIQNCDPEPKSCSFYSKCLESRKQCGRSGYALGFGERYCKKFGNKASLFSPRGEKWMWSRMPCLQEQLTQITNITNWEEEFSCGDIKKFAYTSHPTLAGIGRPAEELLDIKPESVDEIFNVNFKAVLNVTQTVAKMMIDAKLEKATICNMSSISDSVACPGLAIYSCSKAAVTMLTKCSALELGPYGIRVNCVRPAMVQTEAVGRVSGSSKVLDSVKKINERNVLSGRCIVEMDEVADAVLFLSSSSSSIITGSEICLDGGIFTH